MIAAWTRTLAGRWREMDRFWIYLKVESYQEWTNSLAVEGEGKRGIKMTPLG